MCLTGAASALENIAPSGWSISCAIEPANSPVHVRQVVEHNKGSLHEASDSYCEDGPHNTGTLLANVITVVVDAEPSMIDLTQRGGVNANGRSNRICLSPLRSRWAISASVAPPGELFHPCYRLCDRSQKGVPRLWICLRAPRFLNCALDRCRWLFGPRQADIRTKIFVVFEINFKTLLSECRDRHSSPTAAMSWALPALRLLRFSSHDHLSQIAASGLAFTLPTGRRSGPAQPLTPSLPSNTLTLDRGLRRPVE
jgi:hypothetical protein